MIKNILKSKLYVLCSMLFCSLVASVFFFGISSKAASEYASGKVVDDIYTNLGITESIANASTFLDYWYNVKSTYPYAFAYTNSNKTYVRFYMVGSASVDYTKVYWENGAIYISHNTGQSLGTQSTSASDTGNLPLNQVAYFGNYDDYTTPAIDWDNPLYSANIVAPYVNITYRDFTSVPTYDVPLNVDIGSNGNLYVEAFALFDIPTQVFAIYGRNGYDYQTLDKYTIYREIVSPQSFKVPGDFSLDSFHLLLNDAWYNAASLITDQDIVFAFPDGLTNPHVQDTAKNRYYNLRKNQCMAGNNVYLYFRYFTVIDSDFVVGPWRVWSSYDPGSYSDQVPSYIQPYLPAVGTTGTNTQVEPVNTSSPEPSQIYNPSSTGSNVNVTVTQNVPNYPDYPTIASYNKDNLLVDTINQLGSIESFFGEFGSFLVTAFAFMPAWIWAIIGVGFSLSIVVMFLKIL